MLQRWFGTKIHSRVHYFVLLLFVVGIACSNFLMSMGLLLGVLNLLLQADFKLYYRRWSENRLLHFILLFYLLCWLSLFWSDNLSEGFNQLRRLTTLLLVPLIVCAKSLPKPAKIRGLLSIFLAAVVITSVVNASAFYFFSDNLGLIDIREMSLFDSHIRFSMLIAFAISLTIERSKNSKWYILIAAWLLVYTYLSQVITGYLSVSIILLGHLTWQLYLKQKTRQLYLLFSVFGAFLVIIGYYLAQPIQYRETCPINRTSLQIGWQKRSQLPFDGLDLRGQYLSTTLTRYLMSKNGCPSKSGLDQLSQQDINFIELGYADVNETKGGILARLHGLRYQIHHSTNPNDHSLLERFAYWKTAKQVLSKHFMLGVGIGDLQDEMQAQYKAQNSALRQDRRLRPHNYYLTTWLNTGILGLLLLLGLLYFYLKQQWNYRQLQGFLFGLVFVCSFLIEDGLETQMGITMFAFFYAFYSRRVVG
ncbi:MAG: O-antigen ligase family protein [Flavobacteriales bacterium]